MEKASLSMVQPSETSVLEETRPPAGPHTSGHRRSRFPSPVRIDGDIAFIGLSQGFEAKIDASDVALVDQYRWHTLTTTTGHAYAIRYDGGKVVLMHRQLLNPLPFQFVDHADGDGLNNRRSNIRICTRTQNGANQVIIRRNILGIKGVSKKGGRFRAFITPNGRKIHLGCFATAEEAAAAYIGAARVLWGDFARS